MARNDLRELRHGLPGRAQRDPGARQPHERSGPRITLRASGDRESEAGFTLIEIVCVLAMISILAALILPAIPRGTSRTRLEAFALQTAALLKTDRLSAMQRRVRIATELDPIRRTIHSGASDQVVRLPSDVGFDAVLASRCNQRAAGTTIDFFPSGMSCGGTIALTRPGAGFHVRVNWLTGGVEVVPVAGS